MTSPDSNRLADPAFWNRDLESRMAEFAEIRELGEFVPVEVSNNLTGETEVVHAATRYAEVVEVSKRPDDFCSGKGAVSIPDLPPEALEFFGSFINMDNPRHAQQRRIVAQHLHADRADPGRDRLRSRRLCTEVDRRLLRAAARSTWSRCCPSRSRCS